MLMNKRKPQFLAERIVQKLLPYHRALDCQHADPMDCTELHKQKIERLIDTSSPISFVLPAFPAKSPNREKTRGVLPDLGERLSLRFLDQLCEQITAIYPPGAQVCICSDGRVFNDLVNVPDEGVDAYAQEIRNILRADNLTNITTFALDDYYDAMSYAEMRDMLVNAHGETLLSIKEKVKTNLTMRNLFNGIHRFIYEDQLVVAGVLSKNQIRNLSKQITYRVIQRSNAWSHFVEKHFPHSVRLSIHPQSCHSEKFGIMLLKSSNVWATPWHRVLLCVGKEHVLVRNKDAAEMGANPVFVGNQFSHYVM